MCGGLLASDATDRFAIGGAGGWGDLQARDDAQQATNGDLFGSGWIRIGVSKRNEFILGYDSIQLKVKDDSDANRKRIRPITAGLWTSLLPECRLTPVVTIGAGVATLNWMDPKGNKSQPALAAQGGLGAEYFPTSSFSVGALARVHYVASPPGGGSPPEGDRTEATAVTLGLMANLFWGGEEIPPRLMVVVEKKEPVILPAVIEDTDGDGVQDGADWCPETLAGAVVDVNGCPTDSDNDGVLNVLDQCPDTSPQTMVNEKGCPVENVSVNLDIKFALGKAELSREFDFALAKVADFMKRFPATTVLIEGHTDNVGSAAENKRLSQKRAEAVRAALVNRFGVKARRITAKGFGAERPILDNAAPEGRAANRRVMATISVTK